MEQQVIFVLGALSGLVSTMLVYAFVGVFRMSRKLTEIDNRLESMSRHVFESEKEIHGRLADEIRNVYDQLRRTEEMLFQRIETVERETDQRINDDKEIFFNKFDEGFRYTDSRIDSAIDQIKKKMQQGFREPDLIKS